MNTHNRQLQRLIDVLCSISTSREMQAVLECILTDNELKEIENRLRILEMLEQGIPQREIASTLGVGVATVTRGAYAIRNGNFSVLNQYMQKILRKKTST